MAQVAVLARVAALAPVAAAVRPVDLPPLTAVHRHHTVAAGHRVEVIPRSTVPQVAQVPVVVAPVVLMDITVTATDTLPQQQVLAIPQCHP